MLKTVVSLCVFAVLALGTTAGAQTLDRRTFFTFNQPITLPGVTLPAGTYQFRLAEERTSNRVIQVLSADGRTSYALIPARPAQASMTPGEPVVQFMETVAGAPVAVQAWWYPGSSTGYEFVYPREQTLRFARAGDAPILEPIGAAREDAARTALLSRATPAELPATTD